MTERFKNQTSLLNNTSASILVIGCGGVGSMAAFVLAKCGFNNITLIDGDEVEDHNVASQMYSEGQLGMSKVEALAENIKTFSGVECTTHHARWSEEWSNDSFDIIICAVDSMEWRKRIAEFYRLHIGTFIVESRMTGLHHLIYAFDSYTQHDLWLSQWYPDDEASPEICTEKAICFNTAHISGIIGGIVRKKVMGEDIIFCTTNIPNF